MKSRLLSLIAALAIVFGANAQNLSVSNMETAAGWSETLTINIEGASEMTALQCVLTLPQGIELAQKTSDNYGIELGSATDGNATNGHYVTSSLLESGDLLIVVYSMDLRTFKDGTLLYVPVVATDDFTATANGNLRIVHTSTVEAESNVCNDVVFTARLYGEPEPEAAYYWYVGTSEPTELNGAVNNPETDKWVEIGTEIPSYINVTTASDYNFPNWYVLMPTAFGFKPHDGAGIDDESSLWETSESPIGGYTLYSVKDGMSEIQTIFKKIGNLPYNANADYWYMGHTDPSSATEISPIVVYNWASVSDSWEEIVNSSEKIEVNKQPADWDFDSFTALWYVAMPASSGYTPQDADLWETSTATIAGKDYIVYKSEGKVWELNTAFLPEGYVEENPEPKPEPTPEPASVAFTFTRGADVAVNVEGIEGVTASIEAAPAAYLTTAAAANDSILCINQNTSTATADNPNKYTLTITNNSGVDLAFDYINVCGVALTSAGNFQGLNTVRDRVFVVSYGDNTLAPATMRICDDNHCSGVATVNTFEAVDAIPAGSTYVIGVSIYTDGGAGCFYGLTRITLGKNEPEGGDVTDIESPVLEAQGSQLIYDLTGRRVEKAEKGIYIVNGKKVVIK